MSANVVLFDLDGTLLDTISGIAEVFNRALKKLDFKTYEDSKYRYFIGNGFKNVVRRVFDNQNIDNKYFDDFLNEVNTMYPKYCFYNVKPFEGIYELLDTLKERNISIGIITNKNEDAALLCLEKYFSKYDFKYVYAASDKIKIKPDPYAINEIEKQGIRKEDIVFVGDMLVDKQFSENANVKYIHCLWGYETKAVNTDISVKKPLEILEYL